MYTEPWQKALDLPRILKLHTKYTKIVSGCWEHTYKPTGYGRIRIANYRVLLHRVFYYIYNGELATDSLVCHRCHNTKCINPSHLYAGTHLDNMRDKVIARRHPAHKQTHCKYGHEFTTSNTRLITRGSNTIRHCIKCVNRRKRVLNAAK